MELSVDSEVGQLHEVVLHRPHAYKGKDDALRTVLTDPAFAERLRARQRAVQDVRIAGLKEAAL